MKLSLISKEMKMNLCIMNFILIFLVSFFLHKPFVMFTMASYMGIKSCILRAHTLEL